MDKLNYFYGIAKFLKDKKTGELILFVDLDSEMLDGRNKLLFKVDPYFQDEDIPQEKINVHMGTDLEVRLFEKLTDDNRISTIDKRDI